jgi:hypothetical protein
MSTTENQAQGRNAGRVLDMDYIGKLLQETRTRGDYGVVLDDFHKSGQPGIEVEFTGNLAGKDAMNVYTGLNNAKKAQDKDGNLVRSWGPSIKVIKKNFGGNGTDKEGDTPKDEHVFLINTELIDPAALGLSDDSEQDAEPVAAQ